MARLLLLSLLLWSTTAVAQDANTEHDLEQLSITGRLTPENVSDTDFETLRRNPARDSLPELVASLHELYDLNTPRLAALLFAKHDQIPCAFTL